MSKKKSVHTVPNPDGGWYNKQDGKIISKHNKKSTATSAGRKHAIKDSTEHRIHNKNGRISNANSYGNDPSPPRDKK
ncbi:DUF2188 domain-containing protein [Oceanobacillus kimchii]|uniref:DUF2188 domain-containing protein n=1 Tax=Oceanobacillus kimchii TaxID=746691 RepID=UPI00232D1763|nr:DUF2188 domain-containing protein [Oceanobacillus kimchii]